jgi:hypothetical protein
MFGFLPWRMARASGTSTAPVGSGGRVRRRVRCYRACGTGREGWRCLVLLCHNGQRQLLDQPVLKVRLLKKADT